jgi:hypothetical protein
MTLLDINAPIQRLHGAQVYVAQSRSRPGHMHLVTIAGENATCTCEATGTCRHIRDTMQAATDPLDELAALAADRDRQDAREPVLVAQAREAGRSWHMIAVALGRTSEGVRKRYAVTPG